MTDGIPVTEFCALVDIVTMKHGKHVMISAEDKDRRMHLTKEVDGVQQHLGYIDMNTASLVWDKVD